MTWLYRMWWVQMALVVPLLIKEVTSAFANDQNGVLLAGGFGMLGCLNLRAIHALDRGWEPWEIKARIVSHMHRNHALYFLILIFSWPVFGQRLYPHPTPPDWQFGTMFAILIPSALIGILLHKGAFDLTFEGVRMHGLSIEGNPITRFMFARFGFRRSFWVTSAILGAFTFGYPFVIGANVGSAILASFAIIWINGLDFANDWIAIHSTWYLFKHPTFGVPVKRFLPYPKISGPYDPMILKLWE